MGDHANKFGNRFRLRPALDIFTQDHGEIFSEKNDFPRFR